jgi:hypothetical protein
MATEELNPAGANAHGDEMPPMMPLGQPGAHGADPNGDGAWLAAQATQPAGPTHNDATYAGMSQNQPASGTHGAHSYDDYKHVGQEK